MLKLYVENNSTFIEGKLRGKVYQAFKEELGYIPEDALWRQKANKFFKGYVTTVCYDKNYCKCAVKKDGMHFPTGLLSKAVNFLQSNDVEVELFDNRNPEISQNTRIFNYSLSSNVDGKPISLFDYQVDTVQKAIKQQRGIIKLCTGCHVLGTQILMYDGNLKTVESIKVNEQIMGPDSKPRTVLSLCRGNGKLYRIVPNKGQPFVVNEDHILTLKSTGNPGKWKNEEDFIIDISVKDYLNLTEHDKHLYKLFCTGVDFTNNIDHFKEYDIEPYFLGLMLGDGSIKKAIGITTADSEIVQESYYQASKNNLNIRVASQVGNKSSTYFFTQKNKQNNLKSIFKRIGIYGTSCEDKFIPHFAKISSRQNRLKLLAGLLDSDGSLSKKTRWKNGKITSKSTSMDFISKSFKLTSDTAFIARSLGFRASQSTCIKKCQTGSKNVYHRVCITGDLRSIPSRLNHKSSEYITDRKLDAQKTGFKVEYVGNGNYYGFKLDGDHRYLMGDFTVTHNSGKTFCAAAITAEIGVPTIFYVTSTDLLKQAADEMEKFILQDGANIKVGRIGGGYKEFGNINIMTVQTAVRALGYVYKKIDEEDENDSTDISDIKEQIVSTIQSASLVFFDECHHVSSESCQIVADNSLMAHWRYGLSATPFRDKGDDLLIEACFGKTINEIKASDLIKKGYLVKPHIAFVHVKNMKNMKLGPYPSVYSQAIVENEYRNNIICELANNLVNLNRKVLILVQQIAHGERLCEMLPGSIFLHGQSGKKNREEHINKMKAGHSGITISSVIFDEGLDCKPLDALILAGGGKSSTRALQRIGRVIRTYTYSDGSKKEDAFVYDIYDHQKYLSAHAQARRKIYLTEPEFDITDVEL